MAQSCYAERYPSRKPQWIKKKKKILQMLFDAPIYHCTTLLKFFTYDAKQNHNVKGSLHLNTFHKSVSVGTISQIALLHKRRLM